MVEASTVTWKDHGYSLMMTTGRVLKAICSIKVTGLILPMEACGPGVAANLKILPNIAGERISLRALTAGDLESIYTIFSSPQVMRDWSTPPLPDKAAALNLLNEILRDVESGTIMKWGI